MSDVICKVVGDLLPLYADQLTSPETQQYVDEHLQQCSRCRAALESMGPEPALNPDAAAPEGEQDAVAAGLAQRLRRRIRRLWTGIFLTAGVIAVAAFFLGLNFEVLWIGTNFAILLAAPVLALLVWRDAAKRPDIRAWAPLLGLISLFTFPLGPLLYWLVTRLRRPA